MRAAAAYERLVDSPHHEVVVGANRIYLAAAIPDPSRTAGDRWVLTCLPGTGAPGGGRRLSAISMRWMETFVLYLAAGTEDVRGLVNLRRVTLEQAYGSLHRAEQRLGLTFVEVHYRDAGPDQIQARGGVHQLAKALEQDDFAAAARSLARSLMTSRTPYARFHNTFLAASVLKQG